jgi:NTP pyrophosphatase (non-canonical NTP hydrolase)
MNEIEDLTKKIRDFAKLRNWERFHTPKNLAMAVTGEAGELAAEFQWLTTEESENLTKLPIENIELEIADVGIYLLRLCDVLKIDFAQVIKKKIAINQERFPEAR